MISGLSESLTLTLVLMLVFGSVCLYLYTRITQAEQKISLIESILLDLKMASDLRSFDRNVEEEQENIPEKLHSRPEVSTTDARFVDDSEYNEYKDVLSSARASADNSPPINLEHEENEPNSAASSPASVFSPTVTEAAADSVSSVTEEMPSELTTDAASSTSLPGAAPFENMGQLSSSPQPNYEAMTAKELHTLAKQRNITGESKMTRAQLVEELTRQLNA